MPAANQALFWTHIRRTDTCWIWTGLKNEKGYGVVGQYGKRWRAHRLMWTIHFNCQIPPGLQVLHSCDNPSCVNPDHLFLGTNLHNRQDMVAKQRQAKGEKVVGSKLVTDQIVRIRSIWNDSQMTQSQIAALFNVHQSTISLIVRTKRWQHVTATAVPVT